MSDSLYKRYRHTQDWKGLGWYRFQPPSGTKLADTRVKVGRCGGARPVWKRSEINPVVGQIIAARVCLGSGCRQTRRIMMANCGDYLTYFLTDQGQKERYCSA